MHAIRAQPSKHLIIIHYDASFLLQIFIHDIFFRKLFVQFHTDGQSPAIYMKDECPQQPEGSEKSSNINATNKTRIGKAIDIDGFRKLNYDRIPGTTFMRKSDYLLTTFIN
jgi:hypothetical protein